MILSSLISTGKSNIQVRKKLKKDSLVSSSLTTLVSQELGAGPSADISRFMKNNNSVTSLNMAINEPQIPS